MADARKRMRRACDRLAAAGLLVKIGIGWTLPAETPAEAKARRKRTYTSEKQEQRQERQAGAFERWAAVFDTAPPINRATRAKLAKPRSAGLERRRRSRGSGPAGRARAHRAWLQLERSPCIRLTRPAPISAPISKSKAIWVMRFSYM
jgi:hypothetical protein